VFGVESVLSELCSQARERFDAGAFAKDLAKPRAAEDARTSMLRESVFNVPDANVAPYKVNAVRGVPQSSACLMRRERFP